MNPSSQPYQPGELPPVPPAFPGDAAAASLTAEQVQALRNRNYLRADSYTRADSYGRQDSGLSFYEYQIGDGDESPGSLSSKLSTATGYLSPRTPITLTPIITPSSPVPPGETPAYLRQLRRSRAERLPAPKIGGRRRRQLTSQNGSTGERFTGFIHFLRQTYGFIRRDTTGAEDVFMHLVDVDFEPRRGDRVSFALTEYRKRLCKRTKAIDVRFEGVNVEDEDDDTPWEHTEWAPAAQDSLLADLAAWLAAGEKPSLDISSAEVFLDAHPRHAASVKAIGLSPSLALKVAVRGRGAGHGLRVRAGTPPPGQERGTEASVIEVMTPDTLACASVTPSVLAADALAASRRARLAVQAQLAKETAAAVPRPPPEFVAAAPAPAPQDWPAMPPPPARAAPPSPPRAPAPAAQDLPPSPLLMPPPPARAPLPAQEWSAVATAPSPSPRSTIETTAWQETKDVSAAEEAMRAFEAFEPDADAVAQLLQTSPPRRASPTPSPPLSLDALDLDEAEENDLDLECVVCCELYDTSVHAPMVLPCSGAHEICRTCVAALRKADGAIQCPKCREDATGAVNPNRGLIAALRLSRRS